MKFRISAFLLAILLFLPTAVVAAPTSADEALVAVTNWLARDMKPLGAELGEKTNTVQTFSDDFGSPLYHIVYLIPSGFVIVAGDDLVEPIIGFLPEGTYDRSRHNPLGALVDQDVPGRVSAARRAEQTALKGRLFETAGGMAEARLKWDRLRNPPLRAPRAGLPTLSDPRVDALVQSKWDQGSVGGGYCYNYYTPNHYLSGCTATAAAQLMRFHRHPDTGVGTGAHSYFVNGSDRTGSLLGGDEAGGPYDWDAMPLIPNSSITDAQRRAIGAISRDAGLTSHMNYSSGGSGAWLSDMALALKNTFHYGNAVFGGGEDEVINIPGTALKNMINPNLDASHPVLLGIYNDSSGSSGHAILADGYGYDSSTLYHHLNMGWSGTSDAWYNLPDIPAYYHYTVLTVCVYNVFPSGGGEIISGRVTDMGGNPLNGVSITATANGGETYTATTNSRGIYALAKIPSASSYTIEAVKTGCNFPPQTVSTLISTDNSDTVGNVWGVNFSDVGRPPDVDNPTSSNVTTTGAKLGARIESTGGLPVIASGVAYGTSADPDISGDIVATTPTAGIGVFTVNVSGLAPNTLYHFRGYATNSQGTCYTADSVFTTVAHPPTEIEASSAGYTGFTVNWHSPQGTAPLDGYRLDVATDPNFTSMVPGYDGLPVAGTSISVTGLVGGTTYYFRILSINSGGPSTYSDTITVSVPRAPVADISGLLLLLLSN